MPDNLTNETLHIAKGNTETISLKGLPTAGYTWSYRVQENPSIVTITKDFSTTDKSAQGGNANVTFTITANKAGTTTIHFFQKRSWDNSDAVNEKDVIVIIK